jgi:type II secretory pathway pseudopilin PulG
MPRRRIKGRVGYSLLEMVVAAFIFATVSVALAGVFSYHYRAIGSSRLFLVGQHLARSRMEELLAAGFEKAPLFHDGAVTPPPIEVEFTIRDEVIKTQFDVATTVVPGPAPPGHLTCTVTVSWAEANRVRNVRYCASLSPNS